jgi:hypothetical protein
MVEALNLKEKAFDCFVHLYDKKVIFCFPED